MPDVIRILFVDDELKILDGLRRMLRPMRQAWDMHFAGGGEEALELMSRLPFDVIVSDMRMPKMTGVELLEEVRRRHPRIVRFALSGHASREMILRSVGPTHQYLPKPCDAETLKAAISRLAELRDLLVAEKLRGIVAAMESLPSPAALYRKVAEEIRSATASVHAVGEAVAQDLSMTGKMLHLVSTGFFGPPRECCDPAEIVRMLGLDVLRPLAVSQQIFSTFQGAALSVAQINRLWEHGFAVAACARRIARLERCDSRLTGTAFLGGLLHDVGKVVLAEGLGEEYAAVLAEARDGAADLTEIEQARLGATHAQVGGYLLGIWGLKPELVRAVAYHHRPRQGGRAAGLDALTIVHAANAIAAGARPGLAGRAAGLDEDYLAAARLAERHGAWRDACLELLETPCPAAAGA